MKNFTHDRFKIKDLGDLKFFLSLEIPRSADGLFMNQYKYALEILEDIGFLECKPPKSPMDSKHKLSLFSLPPIRDVLQY